MSARSPDGPAGPADPDPRIDLLVRAERVKALRARLPISQATVLLNSAVAAVVLFGHVPPAHLAAWLGAVWAVAVARLAAGWGRALEPEQPARLARWERVFTLGAFANGLAFGAAPLALGAGALPVDHAIFLAFLLGGMAAGSALSNGSHPPAFFAFAVPALAPACVQLLAGGDRIRVGMGVLLAVFGVAVSAIALSGGRALAAAVRLQHRNAALAAQLARTAAGLETRVRERTAELEAARAREREAEHRLAHAARLAGVGSLAAGVAHEINNPLASVSANLAYATEELERAQLDDAQRAALLEALSDAATGAARVGKTVRRLIDLSPAEARPALEPVALPPLLDACLDMAGRELRGRARVVRSYADAPEVLGDRTGLLQVFLNLILNAAEAIPDGDPAAQQVRVAVAWHPAAGEVQVAVSDTGAGIAPELLERIWTPFFTTKVAGRGAGLGLAICRSILAGLGGRVDVESREGAGSTFTVTLRAARAPRDAGVDRAVHI